MDDWTTVSLGDALQLKRGYDLPQQFREPGPVPVVSSSGVTGYHSSATVKGPGVVTGRCGTLGQVFYIQGDFWPLNTTLYVSNFRGSDPHFIAYLLGSLDFSAYSDKAAVPGLNRNDLHMALVSLPPLSEQRAIAYILGTLDDKIELNRRMNETLEGMARALFSSWFVDFEPVRAKMEGCWRRGESLPGLPADFYDLFPDRLVESELGEIPEGWETGVLGDIAEHPRRTVRPEEIDRGAPYIALEHMPRRSIALTKWDNSGRLQSSKFEFKKEEILFGKLRPYFHKVGVAPLAGICSTDIVVVRPKASLWLPFVLGHVSSDAFVDYTSALSTGTKMPRTNWNDMAGYQIALPSESASSAFAALAGPSLERIIASVHESRTLAALRDSLLPKLISGELRVGGAERFLAEAGV